MRRRFIQDPQTLRFVEVPSGYRQASVTATVWDDLPGYESPVTGKWIEGRRARREDLKRNRCRPYEGREQEVKEAARHQARLDARLDELATRMAHRAWAEAPERVRKVFRGR